MKPIEAESSRVPNDQRRVKLLVVLLCLFLSGLAVTPFFFMGSQDPENPILPPASFELRMPLTHDMLAHYKQMKSFHVGLQAGEIYPRWEEDTNHGFGAPTTSYYPPGTYYVTSLFYALSRTWLRAIFGTHLLIMIASAAAFYLYARRGMGRGPALLAMTAYIFLPYHLTDQYQRGAIAELLSFAWMPLMLLFGERLMAVPAAGEDREPVDGSRGWRSHAVSLAGLALSYGCFLWSHPSTAYQFSIAFAIWVGLLAIIKREWKGLLRVGAGIALGCAFSAAYLLPAMREQHLIHNEFITDTMPYHKTYVFVHDIFTKNLLKTFFATIDGIWVLSLVIMSVAGIALLAPSKQVPKGDALRRRVLLWLVPGLVASFLMTSISEPVGRLIPKIDIGVFTWRMLSITTLVVALLSGACLEVALRQKQRPRNERTALGALAVLIVAGGLVFSVAYVIWPAHAEPFLTPDEKHISYATLPRSVPVDVDSLPDDVPEAKLEWDNGIASVELWNPQHRIIRVDLRSDDRLSLRLFNFPGWQATIDGRSAEISMGKEMGNIEINVPTGAHRVEVDFRDTPIRCAGSFVTVAATALIGVLLGAGALKHRSLRRPLA